MPTPIYVDLQSDASKLVSTLQSFQGPLGVVLNAYSALLQAQGSPPDLNVANVSGLLSQIISQAQTVSSQMDQLKAQLAAAQARESPVKTSFPPNKGGGQQITTSQQGGGGTTSQPQGGYSGSAMAGGVAVGATAGAIVGFFFGRSRKR